MNEQQQGQQGQQQEAPYEIADVINNLLNTNVNQSLEIAELKATIQKKDKRMQQLEEQVRKLSKE